MTGTPPATRPALRELTLKLRRSPDGPLEERTLLFAHEGDGWRSLRAAVAVRLPDERRTVFRRAMRVPGDARGPVLPAPVDHARLRNGARAPIYPARISSIDASLPYQVVGWADGWAIGPSAHNELDLDALTLAPEPSLTVQGPLVAPGAPASVPAWTVETRWRADGSREAAVLRWDDRAEPAMARVLPELELDSLGDPPAGHTGYADQLAFAVARVLLDDFGARDPDGVAGGPSLTGRFVELWGRRCVAGDWSVAPTILEGVAVSAGWRRRGGHFEPPERLGASGPDDELAATLVGVAYVASAPESVTAQVVRISPDDPEGTPIVLADGRELGRRGLEISWGYLGTGPINLAGSILIDFARLDPETRFADEPHPNGERHQGRTLAGMLAGELIATRSGPHFELPASEIAGFLLAHGFRPYRAGGWSRPDGSGVFVDPLLELAAVRPPELADLPYLTSSDALYRANYEWPDGSASRLYCLENGVSRAVPIMEGARVARDQSRIWFAWGYAGVGPGRLAASILRFHAGLPADGPSRAPTPCHVCGSEQSHTLGRAFACELLAPIEGPALELSGEAVDRFLHQHGYRRVGASRWALLVD